jgi:uncharacterized membrane protein YidH (DUF202 family)
MNNFNIAATIITLGMLMLLWGARKWNRYQDKKDRIRKEKRLSDKFKQM